MTSCGLFCQKILEFSAPEEQEHFRPRLVGSGHATASFLAGELELLVRDSRPCDRSRLPILTNHHEESHEVTYGAVR